MSKPTKWYCYIIYNRNGPSIYFAGNRASETREALREDLVNHASSIESVTAGSIQAETAEAAVQDLHEGGWDDDCLPLPSEERQPASVYSYYRTEHKSLRQ